MLASLLHPYDWPSIADSNAVLIDATWGIPGTEDSIPKGVLPGAVFFDLAKIKALPIPKQSNDVIAQLLGDIGVSANDNVVIYDRRGVFSAPRLWWLLQRLGHKNISILNGGLEGIQNTGIEIVDTHYVKTKTTYVPNVSHTRDVSFDEILATKDQIVDARSSGRFHGTESEPRQGLRSGHIPNSFSLPYGDLVKDGFILPDNDLAKAIGNSGVSLDAPIITSCGSGVTAAGLAFIFTRLGAKDIRVYTGSWSEYGASDAPIDIN